MCRMGAEVKNPRRTIPYSCIMTCIIVAVVYMLTYVSVIGYLPWYGEDGFVALVLTEGDGGSANYIMGMFAEKMVDKNFANFFVDPSRNVIHKNVGSASRRIVFGDWLRGILKVGWWVGTHGVASGY